jgi:hypothetical protein
MPPAMRDFDDAPEDVVALTRTALQALNIPYFSKN